LTPKSKHYEILFNMSSRFLPLKYPHLTAEDNDLWNDFQILFPPPHLTFMYDVSVGAGRDPGPDYPHNIRLMALRLSKRRIDVVGITPDYLEIFELTQSAGLRATGQSVVYPHLLRITWGATLPIRTTILCRDCQDDIQSVLDEFQIRLVVVPVIPRSPEPQG
jgi:hypothetical protein